LAGTPHVLNGAGRTKQRGPSLGLWTAAPTQRLARQTDRAYEGGPAGDRRDNHEARRQRGALAVATEQEKLNALLKKLIAGPKREFVAPQQIGSYLS